MKKLLHFLLCFSCLFAALSVPAQNDSGITATYDSTTQRLTIVKTMGNLIAIKYEDQMPNDLKGYFTNKDTIEIGSTQRVIEVDLNQMQGFDSLSVIKYDDEKIIRIRIPIHREKSSPNKPENLNAAPQTAHNHMTLYFIVGACVLLLLLLLLLLKRKKRQPVAPPALKGKPVMQVIEEEKNDYKNGLEYVREDMANYYVLDMEEFLRDTAVKQVLFSREVIRKLNRYFKEFLERPDRTNETGCYLIGGWENVSGREEQYNVSLEELVVPGDDAVYDEYSLNFGLKIGVKLGSEIQNLCEKTGRDYVHTAWMHSHPGLGLFLSSHDLVVQKQLTYDDAPKRLIAIVIDTNTPDWQMAVFCSKNNGVMNNKEDLIKTVSFDILNDWSRQKPVAVHPALSNDDAFMVESDDKKERFAFSAKFINYLDDIDNADISNTIFYCCGKKWQTEEQRSWMVEGVADEHDDNIVMGVLADHDGDAQQEARRCAEWLKNYGACISLYLDGNMSLLYVDEDDTIHTLHTSLKEMKEWTRRKRK